MVQRSPTVVGHSSVTCSTALSCTDVPAPTTMSLSSPRSTAPDQIEASGPIVTRPMMIASGITNASG